MGAAAEDNFLGMSDEDFLNANPAEMEDTDAPQEEVLEAEEPAEEDAATEEVEEVEAAADEEEAVEPAEDAVAEGDSDEGEPEENADEDDSEEDSEPEEAEQEEETQAEEDEEKSDSESEKYKDFFNSITSEFKANGKMMKVEDPNDIIRLMQMGANYNRKMAALKPNMKMLKMLEKANLLNEEKLSFLIDINQKEPKALAKLLADSKVDPMDLDLEGSENYKPSDYTVDEREIDLDDVIAEIRDTDTFKQTINLVSNQWDDFSKQAVANEPQLLHVLNDHMASGIYDLISTEIEKGRVLGHYGGKSDIAVYQEVGDAMAAQGAFDHLFKQQAPTPAPAKAAPIKKEADSKRRDKRRAASPAKPAAAQVPKDDFNPLGMSDEEFLKQADPIF